MSWDVLLLRLSEGVRNLSELTDDFESSLDANSEVMAILLELFPSLDVTDPTWWC